jgi:glycogen(starch) synthase
MSMEQREFEGDVTTDSRIRISGAFLLEAAWEVCNQVGGIYAVLRSKAKTAVEAWGSRYCLLGPLPDNAENLEFDPIGNLSGPIGRTVSHMRDMGYDVRYGYWMITGRPRAVLFNLGIPLNIVNDEKYFLWEHDHVPTNPGDSLAHQVVAFGFLARIFLEIFTKETNIPVVAHFHEWMSASCLPAIRRMQIPVRTIFTTHATYLGRILAMSDPKFYDHLGFYDWEQESRKLCVETQAKMERAAAHTADVFTTVSNATALECQAFYHRNPDVILPNGINFERFEVLHEFQNYHRMYKERIHKFVMGHFFHDDPFDLDDTIYLLAAGRYEFRNKGFDILLDALGALNRRLIDETVPTRIVTFIITRRPTHNIHPDVLRSHAMLDEIEKTTRSIAAQVSERLFRAAASSHGTQVPLMDDLVDDLWKLRLRRALTSWKSGRTAPVVTHLLADDAGDEILAAIRRLQLFNRREDRVKIVYHPDFISSVSPLFSMDYDQFVRGCHIGVFPSCYEPWGYTPLECLALGIPSITSDLSGFGSYVLDHCPEPEKNGIYVLHRRHRSYGDAAQDLAGMLGDFIRLNRRDRIALRNRVEANAGQFDWSILYRHYGAAYRLALGKP